MKIEEHGKMSLNQTLPLITELAILILFDCLRKIINPHQSLARKTALVLSEIFVQGFLKLHL